MTDAWRLAAFEEFINLRKEFITIRDDIEYDRVTVQLHAKGVKKRDTVLGAKIKTKKQQVVRSDELLVAEIDAKVGGFGLVPPELDGAIVSSHYYVYEIDTDAIDVDYLEYYLRSGRPTEEVQQYVKGSTNYASIRDYHFPKLNIPLPPLEEQQRIVAVLDAFAMCVAEAQELSSEMLEEANALLSRGIDVSYDSLPDNECEVLTIKQVATYVQRGKTPKYADTGEVMIINQRCVREQGLSLEDARYLADDQLPTWQPKRYVREGDVLLNSTGEGTLGRSVVVDSLDAKAVVDSHVTIIRPNQNIVLPKWVNYFLQSTTGQEKIHTSKTGSTKQTELSKSSVLALELVVPSIETQRKIIHRLDLLARKSHLLRNWFRESTEQWEAMMPMLLDLAFRGKLNTIIPTEVLEEVQAKKAVERERQRQVLAARRAAVQLREERAVVEAVKIEVDSPENLTELLRQLTRNGEQLVTAKELWRLSGLADIDTFYDYLKVEHAAGRIVERREGYEVYLEPSHANKTSVD